ncbi:MAG: Holliday junction branch migration protein RuvA [Chitinophagales bacterium]
MIAYIKGQLVVKTPTYVILETAGGVAYRIKISLNTHKELQGKKTCQLFTFTQMNMRDGQQTLYGFMQTTEYEMFTHLISVSGVGASAAQMMLSVLSPSEIQEVIVGENLAAIQKVKGIGIKTAKRLIVELKDKLLKEGIVETQTTMMSGTGVVEDFRQEALPALMALGIGKPMAQKAMNRAIRNAPKKIDSVETLIREALKAM